MPKFKVQNVEDVNEFQSQHGPMYGFRLACFRDDGRAETVLVNAKKPDTYKAGTMFEAEATGQEYKGHKRYKRLQPAPGTEGRPQSLNGAPVDVSAPQARPMDYERASLLLKRCLDDFGPSAFEPIFRAILEGRIENPVKAKTTVTFFGKELETAGVEQEAWDEMAALCQRLASETDEKNVRALLIATCGVQSRKDLTADNARLFIAALRTNLAAAEANRHQPIDESEDIPF